MTLVTEPIRSQPVTARDFQAFILGYLELLAAAYDAHDAQQLPRANPLSLPFLRERGVDEDLLLWMLYQAHVEHLGSAHDLCNGNGPHPPLAVVLSEASQFALTEAGELFSQLFLSAVLLPQTPEERSAAEGLLRLGLLVPQYDDQKRLFLWGRHVLKRYRQPSLNQETVLCAAEELRWPAWFDDPLPRGKRANPKIRLHDTIKNLNRHQQSFLVHFQWDGSGSRVGWELLIGRASPELPQPGR